MNSVGREVRVDLGEAGGGGGGVNIKKLYEILKESMEIFFDWFLAIHSLSWRPP